MSAADRLAAGYEPNFDIDYQVGAQGELFVANIIDSLTKGNNRVEVKTDEKVAQTGNVYIEYECLRSGQWKPSGIAITNAEFWVFVLPAHVVIVAPTENVKALARRYWKTHNRGCDKGSHPTHGVAVPVGLFVKELYRYVAAPSKAA